VPILVFFGLAHGHRVGAVVETTQMAPPSCACSGLNLRALRAARIERSGCSGRAAVGNGRHRSRSAGDVASIRFRRPASWISARRRNPPAQRGLVALLLEDAGARSAVPW
jgi:hypothetical protein